MTLHAITLPPHAHAAEPPPEPDPQKAWLRRVSGSIDDAAWVHSAPFRAHLHRLLGETGLPWRVLAIAAGVPPRVVSSLLFGRRGAVLPRLRARDAAGLLLLTPEVLRVASRSPGHGEATRIRVKALRDRGHSLITIARWLGLGVAATAGVLAGTEWCSEITALRAAAACSAQGLGGWWAAEHLQGQQVARWLGHDRVVEATADEQDYRRRVEPAELSDWAA